MSEEKQALVRSIDDAQGALREKINYLRTKVEGIENDIETIETKGSNGVWVKGMRVSPNEAKAVIQMFKLDKDAKNKKISELEAISSGLTAIGNTVQKLDENQWTQAITKLRKVPRGIKTTWSYDICHFLSETTLHKIFLKVYDPAPGSKASMGQLAIFMILVLPLTFAFLFWPLSVACVGAMLLSVAFDVATRYVKNYRDRDVIDFDQNTVEAYKKALEVPKTPSENKKPRSMNTLGNQSSSNFTHPKSPITQNKKPQVQDQAWKEISGPVKLNSNSPQKKL